MAPSFAGPPGSRHRQHVRNRATRRTVCSRVPRPDADIRAQVTDIRAQVTDIRTQVTDIRAQVTENRTRDIEIRARDADIRARAPVAEVL
ncbi:hypothetical protein, partial [Prauserella marina]|uniref:hypothetical protein n=1 Tax=Prauserella marina TaxID=530584 RepID=UPI001B87F3AE